MRRERFLTAVAVLAAASAACFLAPAVAGAATPQQICQDLADGKLDGNYSAADLAAYRYALQHDPTVEGYCSPLPVLPATPARSQQQCVQVAPNTPGAVEASNGTWYRNAPGGNAAACVHGSTGTAPTSGVKGAQKVKAVRTAARTSSPPQRVAAPLGSTHTAGTLPFTGLQLTIVAVVGLALLAGGVLLRLTGRGRRNGA